MTFLAVGQGDCTIVRLPDGSAVLVDAGGDPSGRYDPGARDVLPFLRDMGVTRLAAVFVSHPHPDHLQGLPAVVAGLGAERVYASHDRGDEAARAAFARMPPAPRARRRGRGHARAESAFACSAPRRATPGSSRTTPRSSCTSRYGHTSFLLPGRRRVGRARPRSSPPGFPASTWSRRPTTAAAPAPAAGLIAASRPRWVVFPVGAGNRYGFPHAETVARWREFGAELLRTDEGPVRFRSDGRRVSRAAPEAAHRRLGAPRGQVTGRHGVACDHPPARAQLSPRR